ncbi:hypothetical protein F383_16443 [Gossypium arboreum]|uniref:Uncharacterized protein n=1 Tax=Gossypium arboreum TaxID=29729 RepID=A0A0B0NFP4_GOSAR|nr:hypothetical protein F383_16443 [Gossypium arboreum]
MIEPPTSLDPRVSLTMLKKKGKGISIKLSKLQVNK